LPKARGKAKDARHESPAKARSVAMIIGGRCPIRAAAFCFFKTACPEISDDPVLLSVATPAAANRFTAIVGDSVRAKDRSGSFGPDFARSGNSFANREAVTLANEAKHLWAGHNLASPGDVIFAIV
jgi:hypothetical protein